MDKKLFVKHVFTQGIVLGISLSVLEFTAFYFGMLFRPFLSYIYMGVVFIALVRSIRRYRDTTSEKITLQKTFLTAFFVCAISGLIWSVYRYLQYKFSPILFQEITRTFLEAAAENMANYKNMDMYISLYENMLTPVFLAFINTFIITMVFGGSILSLFLAYNFNRKNNIQKK